MKFQKKIQELNSHGAVYPQTEQLQVPFGNKKPAIKSNNCFQFQLIAPKNGMRNHKTAVFGSRSRAAPRPHL